MNRLKTIFILLLIVIILQPLRQETIAQARGIIKGKIEIEEVIKTSRRQRTGYQHDHTSTAAKTKTNEAENVVIYLEEIGTKKDYSFSGKNPTLTQQNAEFIPKVLPILKGTTVEIRNDDKIYHNVFSLSDSKPFNIGRRPKGEIVPQTFNNTGVVRVFCDIHSHMSAYIIVLDNPFFTVGGKDGNYTISNIPPGKYLVTAWHDNFNTNPVEVTIEAGEIKTVNFDLK